MGGVTAPVAASGSWPAWIVFVAKRIGISAPGTPGPPVIVFLDPARQVVDHVNPGDDPVEAVLLADDDSGSAAEEELVDCVQVRARLHERGGLVHYLSHEVVVHPRVLEEGLH